MVYTRTHPVTEWTKDLQITKVINFPNSKSPSPSPLTSCLTNPCPWECFIQDKIQWQQSAWIVVEAIVKPPPLPLQLGWGCWVISLHGLISQLLTKLCDCWVWSWLLLCWGWTRWWRVDSVVGFKTLFLGQATHAFIYHALP